MSTPRTKPCACAACKCLGRKCKNDCVFAPYFPPDQPEKFAKVHKVFGSSNVAKLLKDLPLSQRKNAANSLAYEAESRLGDRSPRRDSVYGCADLIAMLHQSLKQVQTDIVTIKKDLATDVGQPPQQVHPGNPSSSATVAPTQGGQFEAAVQQQILRAHELAIREQRELLRTYELLMQPKPTMSFNDGFEPAAADGGSSQHHDQQSFKVQHLAAAVAAREQQEILQTHEQQQQQENLVSYNSGFDPAAASNSVTVTASGFYQTNIGGGGGGGVMSPSLAPSTFENPYQTEPQQGEHHGHPLQTQLQQLQTQLEQLQQALQAQSESEKGKGKGKGAAH